MTAATPPVKPINVFQPALGVGEAAAVRRVMMRNWPGRGPQTAEFERRFATHVGVEAESIFSIATCTEGLFQAIQALALGPGDDVVVPSIHFIGAGNAIAAAGARPVFCDVDPWTLNPRLSDIRAAVTSMTKAVIILHYGGLPGEVGEIAGYCRQQGFYLIEDAALAVASSVDGRACGTFGDIGLWSFDSMKTIVCGDGGMVYCRDAEVAARIKAEIFLGLDNAGGITSTAQTRWWEIAVNCFGRRAILNDVAASIGLVQLDRLSAFVTHRARIHARYIAALRGYPQLRLPPAAPPGHSHSHAFFWVQTDNDLRDELAFHLRRNGIYTTFRYPPLHTLPLFGHNGPALPNAEAAAASTLLLPQHQGLRMADVDRVVAAMAELLGPPPRARGGNRVRMPKHREGGRP